MAITNKQMISLYMIEKGINEELHTFQKWKALGYSVKRGEKSQHRITIWKHATRKDKDGNETSSMFLKESCFFLASQVEKLA